MRFSAPTEGFIWLDSISEIVELVTPERLASSRWDSLLRARTNRNRSPTSMLIVASRGLAVKCVADRMNVIGRSQQIQWLGWFQKRTCCIFINMMSVG